MARYVPFDIDEPSTRADITVQMSEWRLMNVCQLVASKDGYIYTNIHYQYM